MADTSITSNVQDGAGIVSNIVSGVSVTGQIATGAKGDKGDKGDTGTTDHLLLTNIGTNTHAQIDTAVTASTSHIANTSNPHSVTKAQVGLSNVPNTDFTAAVAANTAKLTADTANVTAAGALMDSEVTNLAQVKAFSSSDYATSAQGTASSSHIANTSNPHSVTKTQVGLGNVDNTSDVNKPISTATQTALNAKANASGTVNLTGNQTIAGVKTFTSAPIAPSGTSIGGVLHLTGSGFPNGVVSASVGSIYIDTAVTNGASSWIKKSGTGNTGWQVLEGDTGWRNISALIPPASTTGGTLKIRRVNADVYLQADNLYLTSTSSLTLIADIGVDLGASFRPVENLSVVVTINGSNAITRSISVRPTSTTAGITHTGEISSRYWASSYYTTQAWPTTLPGTAA